MVKKAPRRTAERILEVTPDKQIAWQFTAADAPELNLTWISSLQVLPNGNLIVGNFLRGQEGKGLWRGNAGNEGYLSIVGQHQ